MHWPSPQQLGLMFAQTVVIIAAAWALSSSFNEQSIKTQISSCERITADRVDNARALTALEAYYAAIANPKQTSSVQEDVKRRARAVRNTVAESANQLRLRILLCGPLIRDDKHIIDERLLREAQGHV